MSTDTKDNDGFIKVSYKRKTSNFQSNCVPNQLSKRTDLQFDKERAVRRIFYAKEELLSTDFFDSVLASLREALSALENPRITEIICLGLGKFGECTISRYQFALLLILRDIYNVAVSVYDPIFDKNDYCLLKHFSIIILTANLAGKYKIRDQKTVLFYLPHCSKQLSNNLLWSNWGLNLKYCIIVGNSFSKIVEDTSIHTLLKSGEYIYKISPYVLEIAVINSFKFYEIFNETAVHVFPKLNILSQDIWDNCSEPKVLKEMSRNLNLLRRLISELRYTLPQGSLKDNLSLKYILEQFRKYKTTDEQLCKARAEMEFVARAYLCYLKSSRLEQIIYNEFHSKGERNVEDTAKMVGFKLPHDPK